MYVTTNSAVVWKRMADENQQSARILARVAVTLFVLLIGVGVYAFSANAKYRDLCSTINNSAANSDSLALDELATKVANGVCA